MSEGAQLRAALDELMRFSDEITRVVQQAIDEADSLLAALERPERRIDELGPVPRYQPQQWGGDAAQNLHLPPGRAQLSAFWTRDGTAMRQEVRDALPAETAPTFDQLCAWTDELAEAYNCLVDENDSLRAALERAERERDEAIAHDRQPYPTAEAYELVCATRDKWEARAVRAEQKRDDVDRFVAVLTHHALAEIRCDHIAKTYMPVCNCAKVALGLHGSVPAAKEAWAWHVWEELRPAAALSVEAER